MFSKKSLTLFAISSFLSFNAYADIYVAPHCLFNKLTTPYTKLASTEELVLFKTDINGLKDLVKNKFTKKEICGGFINVTGLYHTNLSAVKFLKSFELPVINIAAPKKLNFAHAKEVSELYNLLTPNNIWSKLSVFSQFQDRFSNSDNGIQSADWVKKQLEEIVKLSGRTDITINTIPTPNFKQPSIVVKVGSDLTNAGLVLGSHMDSVASDSQARPAADDNGSGAMTLLETFRTVLASKMTFKKPLYFIWYAAEEEGLRGSQKVVATFRDNNIPVESAINFDMTGYAYHNERTIYLVRDNINAELTTLLEQLTKEYVKQPVAYTRCGYFCSDHVAWSIAKVKAAFPFEGKLDSEWNVDPYIHTANDTIDILSLDHMTDFAKLGLAFIAETAL